MALTSLPAVTNVVMRILYLASWVMGGNTYPASVRLLIGLKLSGTVSLLLLLACSLNMSTEGISLESLVASRSAAVLLGAVAMMCVLVLSFHTCLMASTRVTVLPVPGGPNTR